MKLSARDRNALIIGGVAVLLLVMVQFAVLPFMAEKKRLRQGIVTRQAGLSEMRALSSRYRELNDLGGKLDQILAKRASDFSLFSFLEQQAADSEVKDKIAYMKPSKQSERGEYSESVVEMKLQGVSLEQLVHFLEKIESPENAVSIRRISIQQSRRKDGSLDAIMQVFTVKKAAS